MWLFGDPSVPAYPILRPLAEQRVLFFQTEGNLSHPASTPLLADSVLENILPLASDLPSEDLAKGIRPLDNTDSYFGMALIAIPRHGNRPSSIPKRWPANQALSGAVNVSFFDGHAEQVKLERLWQLYWHKDYVPPGKRPGLP